MNTYWYKAQVLKDYSWVTGSLVYVDEGNICRGSAYILPIVNMIHAEDNKVQLGTFIQVDPQTICRCTDVLDTRDIFIFEYDIVKCDTGRICKVVWKSSTQYCGWDLDPIDRLDCPPPEKNHLWDRLTVVGNSWDDP